MPHRRLLALAPAVAWIALTAGCERDMRDMYDQPRPHADAASNRVADGRDERPPATGSLPYAGAATAVTDEPPTGPAAPTYALLERGRQRYDIFCSPCHSVVGDGDGMVVRRGFPRPPSLLSADARAESDARLDTVIQAGQGTMAGFGTRIDDADRRAIVAYIHALQLSQHATLDDVPADSRALLAAPRQ